MLHACPAYMAHVQQAAGGALLLLAARAGHPFHLVIVAAAAVAISNANGCPMKSVVWLWGPIISGTRQRLLVCCSHIGMCGAPIEWLVYGGASATACVAPWCATSAMACHGGGAASCGRQDGVLRRRRTLLCCFQQVCAAWRKGCTRATQCYCACRLTLLQQIKPQACKLFTCEH